jgi:pilus assembly protein TadC
MATIPFSFLPPKVLIRVSKYFMKWGTLLSRLNPYLQMELNRADMKIEARKYGAMCFSATSFFFIFFSIILTLGFLKIGKAYFGVILALVLSVIILFMQLGYPKLLAAKRIKKLDADLLIALRAIMIQLNSGVALFEAMAIISNQEFGEVSKEFKEAVKQISVGVPQIEALELMAVKNPSPYFRRTLWQIINAMKEGAAIKEVMGNVITNLTKEQVIQIEKYGSQLSPLAMFYMMGAVILPVLAVTFLIVLTSFIEIEETLLKLMFVALLAGVIFIQIIFSGIIKTKRPSLLGESG